MNVPIGYKGVYVVCMCVVCIWGMCVDGCTWYILVYVLAVPGYRYKTESLFHLMTPLDGY